MLRSAHAPCPPASCLPAVLQFSAALCWLASSRPNALCLDAARIQYWQLLAAVMLAAFGQSLNAGIYKAIGKAGVYYGFKLRHSVPWHTGAALRSLPFDCKLQV